MEQTSQILHLSIRLGVNCEDLLKFKVGLLSCHYVLVQECVGLSPIV